MDDMSDVLKPAPPYLTQKIRAGMKIEEARLEFEERLAQGMTLRKIMRLEARMTPKDRVEAVERFRRQHPPLSARPQ